MPGATAAGVRTSSLYGKGRIGRFIPDEAPTTTPYGEWEL